VSDHLSTRAPSEPDSGGVPVSAAAIRETAVSPPISCLVSGQQNGFLETDSAGADLSLAPSDWTTLEQGGSSASLPETQRLALLDASADEYARSIRPANTARAYDRAWRSWISFCDLVALPPSPASRGMLAGYVRWRWLNGDAPATIDATLGGIATSLRDRGHPIDKTATAQAREILKSETRRAAEAGELNRGRGQAPAVTIPQLRAMSAACPEDLGGLRDRALLVIGFGIAARRSELAGLLVADVARFAEGLRVSTRYGKKGGRSVVVRPGRNELTDPVRAWSAWCGAVFPEPENAALRRVDRWGRLGGRMSPRAIGERVAVCAERAGLEGVTGHSLRAGLATSARRAGKPVEQIADQGGWARNSASLLGYIRSVDQWEDSATADIGL
jgi:integrase